MGYLLAILLIGVAIYGVNISVIVISENDRAIVERIGTYHRILKPGVRFIIPLVEKLVYVDTLRERFLDIKPQDVITQDGLTLLVDAVVYWKILDIKKAYYEIENIEEAFVSIVLTSMRSEISGLKAKDISSSKSSIDKTLLKRLDETTSNWCVKVIRVEIQNIIFPKTIQEAMEKEWAALSEKEARIAIAEAESKRLELLAQGLGISPKSPDFLQFIVATQYVESNQKLGESSNSKILFVDPAFMSDSVKRLLGKKSRFYRNDNNEPPEANGKKPLL